MPTFLQKVTSALALTWISISATGCSVLGYYIGGAIDGEREFEADSAYVNQALRDSKTLVYPRSFSDGDDLSSLLNRAAPGNKVIVNVLTRSENLYGRALTIDTVLAIPSRGGDRGSPALLPGETVALTIHDSARTRISGRRTWKTRLYAMKKPNRIIVNRVSAPRNFHFDRK